MKKQAVFREQALTNNPSSSYHSSPQQVRFHERAFVMGNVVGVNAYHLNRTALKQRFAEDGSHVHETAHFLVCTQVGTPTLQRFQQLFTRVKLEAVGNGASNS